jgi:hypothetical protein
MQFKPRKIGINYEIMYFIYVLLSILQRLSYLRVKIGIK